MSRSRFPQLAPTIFITALIAACASGKRIDEGPITVMRNGDRVSEPAHTIDAAAAQALEARMQARAKRDSLTAAAFADCDPGVCAALGRGELSLRMTEAQVMAATRTTDAAWTVRRSRDVVVLSPRDADASPRDAVAPVALVQLAGGGVASITYREVQGLRTVRSADDVTNANRARAVALTKEGDALAAAGDFTAALERYDRASVVDQADAELQYKMATSLDKLLRPREAELRYRLFLHELELEKIEAVGDAHAKLAEAIAQAKERIIVLDKRNEP
jgi:tetratricopeptide (TPR) repeat protein